MNRRAEGAQKERLAAGWLLARGCRILALNFRSRMGEIDLVAEDERGVLRFVEVKYRRTAGYGSPAEAVDWRKQWRICRAADYYRLRRGIGEDRPCQFDVIAILGDEVEWLQNAFPYRPAR